MIYGWIRQSYVFRVRARLPKNIGPSFSVASRGLACVATGTVFSDTTITTKLVGELPASKRGPCDYIVVESM